MLDQVSDHDARTLSAAIPLVQERMETLGQAVGMLGFLFVAESSFAPDPDDAARMLGADAEPALTAARAALGDLEPWTAAEIELALRTALIEGLGLKPKVAFGSLRVAVTGRRVSPPLFESIELLGRDRTLARIDAALP
jgi:glutamyl-tRNA synthetase